MHTIQYMLVYVHHIYLKAVYILIFVSVCLSHPLTKSQFALVVGHSVQQGDGATGINYCLLQEINL